MLFLFFWLMFTNGRISKLPLKKHTVTQYTSVLSGSCYITSDKQGKVGGISRAIHGWGIHFFHCGSWTYGGPKPTTQGQRASVTFKFLVYLPQVLYPCIMYNGKDRQLLGGLAPDCQGFWIQVHRFVARCTNRYTMEIKLQTGTISKVLLLAVGIVNTHESKGQG